MKTIFNFLIGKSRSLSLTQHKDRFGSYCLSLNFQKYKKDPLPSLGRKYLEEYDQQVTPENLEASAQRHLKAERIYSSELDLITQKLQKIAEGGSVEHNFNEELKKISPTEEERQYFILRHDLFFK